ncbi:uncharacterized protein GGR32_002066 [Mesonia hippocampi]|uniref:TPM domain-containing protein n=1 Tax=Mesonia hippocampi TaxID=1628250 RepID=A0A840ES12_9FLAO|nr:TPM domain-containing protein [Mesonia hippocampi]MBB4119760.1 uncharacterized protein [Mesonia hippocampi]
MITQKNKFSTFYLFLITTILACNFFTANAQLDIPKLPSKQTSVYDGGNVLQKNQKQALEHKLLNYADSTSTQIVVATIPSLNGEYIGTYSAEWAHQWGIGQKGKDNGLLILLARDERKIWISTGYGLEAHLTDALSKQIIDQVIIPEFKQGNYYAGLDKGTTAIISVLSGTYKAIPKPPPNKNSPFILGNIIVFIFFVVIILLIIFRKNKGNGGNGGRGSLSGSLLDAIILSSMGRGSWGGSSGSSGGSFGGGGFGGGFGSGGFGGGGAGGSW